MTPAGFIVTALLAMAAVAVYLAPTLVAIVRRAANAERVLLVNVLYGWTLVGWAVALLLAVRSRRFPPPAAVPGAAAPGCACRESGELDGERPAAGAVDASAPPLHTLN